jgi:hypothetical protein
VREEFRFHRWLVGEEVYSPLLPAGRLARLCRILRVDLRDAGVGENLPRKDDYEESIIGALRAAWSELEAFQADGPGEQEEVVEAAQQAAQDLISEEKAVALFRSAWACWLRYLPSTGPG